MTSTPIHDETSAVVQEVINDRTSVYGDPIESYTRIAQVWTGILGFEVTPAQVTLCMIGTKAVRSSITPDYSDNSDDIEGYLDMFRTIVGPDMIHARLTSEYLAERQRRADAL